VRAAFLLLGLALPLTACGGSSTDPVARAADKTTAKRSERIALTGSVTESGQTIQMTGNGDFQNAPELGQMHLSVDAAGKTMSLDEIQQGSTIYMRSPQLASVLPHGKSWISVDLPKAGEKLGLNLGNLAQQPPADILKALRGAGSVTKIGDETIDGAKTTHYRATIDSQKLTHSASVASRQPVPVDVWIGSDGLLRRLTMKYSGTALSMDLSNYGEPVNVQVPAARETVDMTKLGGTP
jgi:hypothetical protein